MKTLRTFVDIETGPGTGSQESQGLSKLRIKIADDVAKGIVVKTTPRKIVIVIPFHDTMEIIVYEGTESEIEILSVWAEAGKKQSEVVT